MRRLVLRVAGGVQEQLDSLGFYFWSFLFSALACRQWIQFMRQFSVALGYSFYVVADLGSRGRLSDLFTNSVPVVPAVACSMSWSPEEYGHLHRLGDAQVCFRTQRVAWSTVDTRTLARRFTGFMLNLRLFST